MGTKILAIVTVLIFCHAFPLAAKTFPDALRAGPVYLDQPGQLAVVVEVPAGTSLNAADFHLLMDDRRVTDAGDVKSFEESGKGMALVVCLDVSGTMRGGPLKEMKEALLSFLALAATRPQDRIALVSFADDVRVESAFAASRQRLTDTLIRLKTRGDQTRLYHALYQSLGLLQDPNLPKRRRIVVISDGKDEGSTESLENVTTKARALDIPIDALGRGRIAERYLQILSGIAESAGGEFIEIRPDTVSLKDAMTRLYRDLLESQSLVVYFGYPRQEPAAMSRNAAIELTRTGGGTLTAPLAEPIPQAKVEASVQPPPSPHPTPPAASQPPPANPTVSPAAEMRRLLWVLLPLLAVIALVVALVMRMRSAPPPPQPQPPPEPTPLPPVDEETPAPPDTVIYGERGGETRVGAYFPAPAPGRPAAWLVGVGGGEGTRFPLEKELVRIGAGRENDVRIANDEYVSGNHAIIRYQNGSLFLTDEGSLNGTYVNEQKLSGSPFSIGPGDRLRFGNSTFVVESAGR